MKQTYLSMKDSKIDWLKEIPTHWAIQKVKHQFVNLDSYRIPLSSEERGSMENKIYDYYGASGIIDKVEDYLFDEPLILIGEDGANLFSRSTPLAFVAEGKYWVNNHAHILKPKEGPLYYWSNLLEIIDYTIYITGSAQPKLTQDALANIEIPVPPVEEQIAIWRYLDPKLSEIDGLLSMKKVLVSKLELQRQSIITEAVTKGLNPNVKMKDSGVDWIGEIPEHWVMKKMKYIGQAVTGLTYSPEDLTDERGTIVLRSTNIQKGEISLHDNVYVNKEIPNKLITKKNDILICSRNGSRHLIGKNALIESEINLSFGAFTTVFRSENNDFIYFVLNSNFFQAQLGTYLTSTINQLTIGNLNNMDIVLPPRDEQIHIVNNLREIMDNYNELLNKIENQINKLKEYRQSLITEAVTGKIDVRDMELD